jgi:class 3 adenylate cyclase
MDYTAIGDSVNAVFRLQTLTKSSPNGIIISEATLRAVQARLNVREIDTDGIASIGNLKTYELIGVKTGG